MNPFRPAAVLALTAIAAIPVGPAHSSVLAADSPDIIADYYGTKIDLSDGWSGARACATDGQTAACFDTEAELDRYLAAQPHPATDAPAASTCASATRLYAGTSFGLPTLAVTTRLSWQNLSAAGFDNTTSSYKIGSCRTILAKDSGGGGSQLSASAGTQATTMPSGWDNVISSIYLS